MLWWILVISGEWRRPMAHILERNSSDYLNNTIIGTAIKYVPEVVMQKN